MSNDSFEFRPSGTIEFEQLEPEAVAKQLTELADDPMDTDALSINFGRRKDHKPAATERMLAGSTIDWLVSFAADSRPKALCDRYPHVANRLAGDWAHQPRALLSLQVLADDERWGSPGFPAQVQGELQRLLQLLKGSAS
jgi:hypothetical protein